MRQFFREFQYDPSTFENPADCPEYQYSEEAADRFYEKHNRSDRKHFAVMCGEKIVGDLYLKNIDPKKHSCTMSIHMKNDSVKNKGYGTQAEQLALTYAFQELNLETVYADALLQNTRSRHVLTKVGFLETHQDDKYAYYVCCKAEWHKLQHNQPSAGLL